MRKQTTWTVDPDAGGREWQMETGLGSSLDGQRGEVEAKNV